VHRILKQWFCENETKSWKKKKHETFSVQEYSVMLLGEGYQHAVSKCETPNTQQHGNI